MAPAITLATEPTATEPAASTGWDSLLRAATRVIFGGKVSHKRDKGDKKINEGFTRPRGQSAHTRTRAQTHKHTNTPPGTGDRKRQKPNTPRRQSKDEKGAQSKTKTQTHDSVQKTSLLHPNTVRASRSSLLNSRSAPPTAGRQQEHTRAGSIEKESARVSGEWVGVCSREGWPSDPP